MHKSPSLCLQVAESRPKILHMLVVLVTNDIMDPKDEALQAATGLLGGLGRLLGPWGAVSAVGAAGATA